METVSLPCNDHAVISESNFKETEDKLDREPITCYYLAGPFPPVASNPSRQFHQQRSNQGQQRGNQRQRQSSSQHSNSDHSQNKDDNIDDKDRKGRRYVVHAICHFCEKSGHSVSQCGLKRGIEKTGASITYSTPSAVTRWQKDDPVLKVRVENRDTDDLLAMLATDSGATLIRADVAKRLGVRVYKSGHDFYGLESQPVRAVGVTHLIFKVLPSRRQQPLRVYVCKELPYEIILGHNFLFMSEATIQANHRGFFKIYRYREPLKVIMRIPRGPCWSYLFRVYFPEVFGPQMKNDQLPTPKTSQCENSDTCIAPQTPTSNDPLQNQDEVPSTSRSNQEGQNREPRRQKRRNRRVEQRS